MGIFEYELVAVILGIAAANMLVPGRPVFALCDNTAVDHTVIHGPNKTRMRRSLRSVLWAILASTSAPIWMEYVSSVLNPADPPSRRCTRLPTDTRKSCANVEKDIPLMFRKIFEPHKAMIAAQFGQISSRKARASRWECNNSTC